MLRNMLTWHYILLLLAVTSQSKGANILTINPFPSKSHIIFLTPLINELAKRGHNLTVISPFPQSSLVENVREIKVDITVDFLTKMNNVSLFEMGDISPFATVLFITSIGSEICKKVLDLPEVQHLIMTDEQKFDLIIMSGVHYECYLGFAHKYNASVILQIPNTLTASLTDAVGNPGAYSYIPDIVLGFPTRMNFMQRTINALYGACTSLVHSFQHFPTLQKIMQSYFKDLDNLPSVEELLNNVSLLLINSHESIGIPRPLTPNTIQVGGMHIKPSKELPKDLKKIMNSSKEGVIFFSLGSNVSPSVMPREKFLAFMKAFSKLKQTILWKWDQDTMEGKPDNVHLGKWFPQSDILGHKNVVLFMSHGGLLSLQEAIYHGVPVLGLPVFADQKLNLARAEEKGYAIKLLFPNVTEESLLWAINEILNNPRYRQRASKLSQLFHDQPEPPLERAVYWTEYVLRHGGAPHLRSAALDLAWWQLMLLDVAATVVAALAVPLLGLYLLLRYCRGRSTSLKAKKNQ